MSEGQSVVAVYLAVEPEDVDTESGTGLTESAYERLTTAVTRAGFTLHDGPDLQRYEEATPAVVRPRKRKGQE